jgi:transposase
MSNVHHTVSTSDEFAEVTVIQGSARRRYFPPEVKARIVEESMDPAVSVSAVARRHGLNPNQLFTWRRRLREQIAARRADAAAATTLGSDDGAASPGSSTIEVETADARIRVDASVDEAALARVVSALRRSGR